MRLSSSTVLTKFYLLPNHFAISLLVALGAMSISATSLAGSDMQGSDMQGSDMQGSDMQGSDMQGSDMQGKMPSAAGVAPQGASTPWLQGPRFIATRPGAGTERVHIDVRNFRGHAVDAVIWNAQRGWREAVLDPRDLVGVEWSETRCTTEEDCVVTRFRIADVVRDTTRNTMPQHGDNSDIYLYRVEYHDGTASRALGWKNACRADARGTARGMFISGQWSASGAYRAQGYSFSCTGGVIAKCARAWGYKPWKRLPSRRGRSISLAPLHQACIRAARADYCGTGTSYTRDGTRVDMFDRYGFNVPQPIPGFRSEAGFSPDGAVWIARLRWPVDRAGNATSLACERPTRSLQRAHAEALVHVWSRPRPRVTEHRRRCADQTRDCAGCTP